MGSPSFAEKEKRERSILEGEGVSSPNSAASACPDACKSPTAKVFFSLGDGKQPNVCGVFPWLGIFLGGL